MGSEERKEDKELQWLKIEEREKKGKVGEGKGVEWVKGRKGWVRH